MSVQTIKNYERRHLLYPQRVNRLIQGREQQVVVHDPRTLVNLKGRLQAAALKTGEVDTSTWLTRNECIDLLNVAAATLKNYEKRRLLNPLKTYRRDARGHEHLVVVYDPKELTKLSRGLGRPFFSPREAGEIDARCYEMFDQGRSFREIVVALRLTSDKVRELHEKWLDDQGADIVVSGEAKDALESMVGPFEDVAELVERVRALPRSAEGRRP